MSENQKNSIWKNGKDIFITDYEIYDKMDNITDETPDIDTNIGTLRFIDLIREEYLKSALQKPVLIENKNSIR